MLDILYLKVLLYHFSHSEHLELWSDTESTLCCQVMRNVTGTLATNTCCVLCLRVSQNHMFVDLTEKVQSDSDWSQIGVFVVSCDRGAWALTCKQVLMGQNVPGHVRRALKKKKNLTGLKLLERMPSSCSGWGGHYRSSIGCWLTLSAFISVSKWNWDPSFSCSHPTSSAN